MKVFYRFKNDEKSNLGMPLPAGTVRVYQADSKGGVQFAGEDTISHTPKDEQVRIYVGDAFDVVCERKQMDYKKLSYNHLRNGISNHAAKSQGRPGDRGSARADRRRLGSDELELQMDEARCDNDRIFRFPSRRTAAATLDYRVRVKW